MANTAFRRGLAALSVADYHQAVDDLLEAEEKARRLRTTRGIRLYARITYQLGLVLEFRGLVPEARQQVMKSLTMFLKLGDGYSIHQCRSFLELLDFRDEKASGTAVA